MEIIFTGTPGTGKTTLAKMLAKKKHLKYLSLNELIKSNNLQSKEYEGELIINETVLSTFLKSYLVNKKKFVLDGFLSYLAPKSLITRCVVTCTDLTVLKNRLEKRKYSSQKIKDNLEAETFEDCLIKARERGHNLLCLNTTTHSPSVSYKILDEELKNEFAKTKT